jgi:hypothetical protein
MFIMQGGQSVVGRDSPLTHVVVVKRLVSVVSSLPDPSSRVTTVEGG